MRHRNHYKPRYQAVILGFVNPSVVEPGTRVGGYTLGRQLGAGASGAVYAATDDGGAEVALKLLHPHLDINPEARVQMQQEVSVLQRLRDPNVARVLDAEFDASEAFIVTELTPGLTLAGEVNTGGPLDELDLYELADQLAAALHKTHLAGVVHRDLKPSNVIVSEQGPVLIDFGIASTIEEPPEPGLVVGTPGYLAPELLDGAAPTPSTDWWSWAALLAFAATGRPPFGSGARDDVLLRTRQGRADLVGLPPRTATALMGALAPDPADRTPPAEVLQAIHRDGDATRTAATWSEANNAMAFAPPRPDSAGANTQVILWDPTQKLTWADLGQPTATPPVAATQILPGLPTSTPATELSESDLQNSPAPSVNAPMLPYPAAPTWYTRPAPPNRSALLLAIGALLVALAAGWPLITLGLLALLVIVARCVGTAWEDLVDRRENAGQRRPSDAAIIAARTPWTLLKSVLGALPQLLVGLATGVLLAAAAWWVIGRFEIPPGVIANHAHLLALTLAAIVTVVVTWFATNSLRTRTGARVALGVFAPGRAITYVVIAVLLLTATVIAVRLYTLPATINWWPGAPPPAL